MQTKRQFISFELIILLTLSFITFLEIMSFDLFELVFTFLKDGISWFIGLSFGFVFSSFLQGLTKKVKFRSLEKRKEYFAIFLINMVISLSLVTLVRSLAISFFNQFFIYFHVLFLQWLMILYITFKLKNNYTISGKHLLANELIILVNVILILIFIA